MQTLNLMRAMGIAASSSFGLQPANSTNLCIILRYFSSSLRKPGYELPYYLLTFALGLIDLPGGQRMGRTAGQLHSVAKS